MVSCERGSPVHSTPHTWATRRRLPARDSERTATVRRRVGRQRIIFYLSVVIVYQLSVIMVYQLLSFISHQLSLCNTTGKQ